MSSKRKIIIAIDGYSACGKSTLAKALAKQLHYIFIDSGAMYRGIAYYVLQKGLMNNGSVDADALIAQLDHIEIGFHRTGDAQELYLNGININREIRQPEVSGIVSEVAKIKEVRKKLVAQQRAMGNNGGVVMDGRDIGSVVFPDAELKLFITADTEIRVDRRLAELQQNNIKISREEVKSNLLERDRIDETRAESPLKIAEGAIIIDNSNLSIDELIKHALQLAILQIDKH